MARHTRVRVSICISPIWRSFRLQYVMHTDDDRPHCNERHLIKHVSVSYSNMLCFHTTLTTLVHTTYRDRCKYSSKPRRRPVSHIVYARLLYSCDRSHELAGHSCNTCENQHYQLSSVVQLYLVLDSAQPLRTCGRAEGRHVSRLCVCVCVYVCCDCCAYSTLSETCFHCKRLC